MWPTLIWLGLAHLAANSETHEARVAATSKTPQVVLVLELKSSGVPHEAAVAVTAQLAEMLSRRAELRVLTLEDLTDLVAHQKTRDSLGCEDTACIASISQAANAGFALSGSLAALGNEIVVSVSLVDARKSESVGRASRTVSSLGEVADALGELVAETFGWSEEAAVTTPRYVLPQGREISFAVFDLRPLGLSPETAQSLTQVLAAEIKRVDGTSVVSRDDVDSLLQLEAQKDRLACADQLSCLAEIGGALGVDKLVVGHAGQLADSYLISLRLIDVKSMRVDNRLTETFRGAEEQLIRAVRQAGRALLGINATEVGTLAIGGNAQGARVFVDESEVGELPLPPVAGLTPERHTVRLSKKGYGDWRSDVYVEPGAATPVWAVLRELPPKWYQTWWFWSGVAVVVVASAVSTVYALRPADKPEIGTGVVTINGGLEVVR